MPPFGRKAFFLDRDGVINIDRGYVSRIQGFTFMDGIFPVLQDIASKGYALIVVTNQSGIGRGYYTQEDFRILTEWMVARFLEQGILIAGVYSCPHRPESRCTCRKPAPGLFFQAIQEHGIDPSLSWMIGDKPSDIVAAAAAGIENRVLLGTADSEQSNYAISELSELLNLPV